MSRVAVAREGGDARGTSLSGRSSKAAASWGSRTVATRRCTAGCRTIAEMRSSSSGEPSEMVSASWNTLSATGVCGGALSFVLYTFPEAPCPICAPTSKSSILRGGSRRRGGWAIAGLPDSATHARAGMAQREGGMCVRWLFAARSNSNFLHSCRSAGRLSRRFCATISLSRFGSPERPGGMEERRLEVRMSARSERGRWEGSSDDSLFSLKERVSREGREAREGGREEKELRRKNSTRSDTNAPMPAGRDERVLSPRLSVCRSFSNSTSSGRDEREHPERSSDVRFCCPPFRMLSRSAGTLSALPPAVQAAPAADAVPLTMANPGCSCTRGFREFREEKDPRPLPVPPPRAWLGGSGRRVGWFSRERDRIRLIDSGAALSDPQESMSTTHAPQMKTSAVSAHAFVRVPSMGRSVLTPPATPVHRAQRS
mmetsp:Transcript_59761/g.141493  ORF Transcript_59761/g.141493 Transcript_59761/m.141493 type:complete len:429 (-) Transcript_59761:6-1292(-)